MGGWLLRAFGAVGLCSVCFVLLSPMAGHARVDAGSISTSALAAGRGADVQISLTDHQVRQILAADPATQGPLLSELVRQINEARRRGRPPQAALPEALLLDWVNPLLRSKAVPQKWAERLSELAMTYDALMKRMSDLVARRVGVDDPLIRANAALVVGDLLVGGERLDEVLKDALGQATSAKGEGRVAADQFVSSLMVVRGLLMSLQGDAAGAKGLLLKASGMLGKEDPAHPEVLLLTGAAVAAAGDRASLVDIAKTVLGQVDEKPMPRASADAWQHAQWVAHIWLGADALTRLDTRAAVRAFRSANRFAPTAESADPNIWSGIWAGQYVLAAIGEGDSSIDVLGHQREALRLSREMTHRRPDWSPGWLARAQSDLLSAIDVIDDGDGRSAGPFLQDAMSSLERLASQGHDSTDALRVRLQVLALSMIERELQGDVQQRNKLLEQVSAVADDLKARNVDGLGPLYLVASYTTKVVEAEMHRSSGRLDASLKALNEALSMAEQSGSGDGEEAPWWRLERWNMHTHIADVAEADDQRGLALRHRREAVLAAEREAGLSRLALEWQERLWDSLHSLSKTLGKQYLAEEALLVHERALTLARRYAAGERTYGEWHHREFLALMASTEFLLQRGGAFMMRYAEAASTPSSMYAAGDLSGGAAGDLWTVRTTVGKAYLKSGDLTGAEPLLNEALGIAERALEATPTSDNWLKKIASSHGYLAELAHANRLWLREASHRHSAVRFSGQRSETSLNSSDDQKTHWYLLWELASIQGQLNLERDAFLTITLARELAQQFIAKRPKDPIWQEYLWHATFKSGRFALLVPNPAAAEAAFVAAAGVAEAMSAQGKVLKDWWLRAAESLEALADLYRGQSNEIEARRVALRADAYRTKVNELEREVEVREEVTRQMDELLDVLSLTADEARSLSKESLVVSLQSAIDQATDSIRKSGTDDVRSERLRRLRNALFVVRQLPENRSSATSYQLSR